jgi:LPS export ABC transporter protein LptC
MKRFYIPALLSVLMLGACEQSSTTPSATANSDTLPAQKVLYGVHHVITKDGVRSSILDGDTTLVHEGSETLFLTGVHLQFFDVNGALSGTLTSRKGEYDIVGGLFVARDDVVLVTQDPAGERRIETDELSYNVKTDDLWSDKAFVMKQNGRTTRGSSFKSDGKFSTWNVFNAETTGGLPTEGTDFSF